jgi:hypothetical protein
MSLERTTQPVLARDDPASIALQHHFGRTACRQCLMLRDQESALQQQTTFERAIEH